MGRRDDFVGCAVDQQDRLVRGRERRRGTDVADPVAAWAEVDAGREPGQRHRDRIRDRQVGEAEGQAGQLVRLGRGRGRDDCRDSRVRGARQQRADPAERVAGDRPDRDLRPGDQRLERRKRVGPELARADRQRLGRVRAVTADVDREAVEAGGEEELGDRQGPVPGRLPAVDEGDARAGLTAPRREEPARQPARARRWHDDVLEREADAPTGRSMAAAAAGTRPVGDRRPRSGRQAQTGSRRSRRRSRPCGVEARVLVQGTRRGLSSGPTGIHPAIHSERGEARAPCRPRGRPDSDADPDQGGVAKARPSAPPRPDRRRSGGVADRHPPDGRDQRGLRLDDPRRLPPRPGERGSAGRPAGRHGAEADGAPAPSRRSAQAAADAARSPAGSTCRARSGRATRPSASASASGRCEPASAASRRCAGRPRSASRRARATRRGPLERDRVRNFRPPPLPPLDAARDHELPFGKFRGHTLGQVAAFEPSYVDWLARTITRDPELVAAARSVQADLDHRGVVRRAHPIGRERATRGARRAQARDVV